MNTLCFLRTFLFISLLGLLDIGRAQISFELQEGENLASKQAELTGVFEQVDLLEGLSKLGNYEFTTDEVSGKQFIQGNGQTGEGNFVVFRIEVRIEGQKYTLLPFAEKCTTVNCEQGGFALDGGCDCIQKGKPSSKNSYSNHSMSRNFNIEKNPFELGE